MATEPVGDARTLLSELRQRAGRSGAVLAGFDFPIGLPEAYAARAGIGDFVRFLREDFVRGSWSVFDRVAERPGEISLHRPFYPYRPGGAGQQQLLVAHGATSMDELRRRCERTTATRPAACSLFWTLGPNQVGKAALAGWRQMLVPALRGEGPPVAVWPFEGPLDTLLRGHVVAVAETYPTEYYYGLGIKIGGRRPAGQRGPLRRCRRPLRDARRRARPTVTRCAGGCGEQPGRGMDPRPGVARFTAVEFPS